MSTADDLNLLKTRISKIKASVDSLALDRSRKEGLRDSLLERLEKEFGVKSLEDGLELLKKMRTEMSDLAGKLTERVTSLEEYLRGDDRRTPSAS